MHRFDSSAENARRSDGRRLGNVTVPARNQVVGVRELLFQLGRFDRREGNPDLRIAAQTAESIRQDTHDRMARCVDLYRTAEHIRIGSEAPRPQTVPDHRDGRHACGIRLVAGKRPPDHRFNAQNGGIPLRRHLPADLLRLPISREIEVAAREQRRIVEGALRGEKRPVLRVGPYVLAEYSRTALVIGRHQVDEHQPIGIGKWQRLQQYGIDHGEHRRVGTDSKRQRHDGNRREPWRATEQSQRITEVLPDCCHQTISSASGETLR
jgi:hypothetical protein